ncbi:MAG TPA: sugar porter family MFS transporter [Kiritimatiellia bacterium]|nr:sugar porter family MFS transporter [Kiritimatiellia bacterium]HPS06188.1 sugar porter family MFS transporter [Kiritimatiellia bacterium]
MSDTALRSNKAKAYSLLYIVLVSALGGFLFGFDSGVISGCEKAIQAEFQLSGFWHGFTVSGALIGTIFGAFSVGWPSDRFGRRPTLMLMAVLFLISAAGCAFAGTQPVLAWMRFIGGLAIGGASVVVPLYIVEISPGPARGRLVAMNQLNIVFGILVSYISNFFIAKAMMANGTLCNACEGLAKLFTSAPMTTEQVMWRVMLGVECIPAVAFLLLLFTIPESPRWLVRAGRRQTARNVLELVGDETPEKTLSEIEETLAETARTGHVALFQRRYLKPILLAFFIAFFNQVSGINAINYYAPRIFENFVGAQSALAATIGVGTVNLIFTMLAFLIIDKFGRRIMIIGGSIAMMFMHFLVAWQLSLGAQANPILAIGGILGFIAFFAISSGAVIWVFISEIFPNAVRAKGQALGCFTHWFMCTLISWAFPAVAEQAGTYAFGFFGLMMICQVVFAIFWMPETKGGTIEDIEQRLGIGPQHAKGV